MKIAIPTTENTPQTTIDTRFGRAPWYCLVDLESKQKEFIKNSAISAAHGAGVQAGQLMIDNDVNAVISGKFGPNAAEVLRAAQIQMYLLPTGNSNQLDDIIQDFQDQKLIQQ